MKKISLGSYQGGWSLSDAIPVWGYVDHMEENRKYGRGAIPFLIDTAIIMPVHVGEIALLLHGIRYLAG